MVTYRAWYWIKMCGCVWDWIKVCGCVQGMGLDKDVRLPTGHSTG